MFPFRQATNKPPPALAAATPKRAVPAPAFELMRFRAPGALPPVAKAPPPRAAVASSSSDAPARPGSRPMPFAPVRRPAVARDVFDIFGLPTEVLMCIIDWLWYRHWRTLRRVCRTFCALTPVPQMAIYRGVVARAYCHLLWTCITLVTSGENAAAQYRAHKPTSVLRCVPLERDAYVMAREHIKRHAHKPRTLAQVQELSGTFRVLARTTQFGATQLRLMWRTQRGCMIEMVVFNNLWLLTKQRTESPSGELRLLRASPAGDAMWTEGWLPLEFKHMAPLDAWEPCCGAPNQPMVPVWADHDGQVSPGPYQLEEDGVDDSSSD